MDNTTSDAEIEALEKLLNGEGLQSLWVRIAEMAKAVTGDVRVTTEGTLQDQIDDMKESLIDGKVNFITATEDGSYLTTEDGSYITSEFKIKV